MDGSDCVVTIYLGAASDLSTQCLSRQQQADNLLGIGNHTLTDISAGPSRQQRVTTETRPIRNNIGYAVAPTGILFIVSGVVASVGGIASPTLQSALTTHVSADK